MKMRLPHRVFLSKQAIAILEDIKPTSESGGLVLLSVRSKHRQLSENAVDTALRRMGYA